MTKRYAWRVNASKIGVVTPDGVISVPIAEADRGKPSTVPWPTTEATARLLAGAPEMCEALANASASFDAVMEYLCGCCPHSPGTDEDCDRCSAYTSAQRGREAIRALLARLT